MAIGFGSGEGPAAGGLGSEIGEILARARGIEFGLRDVAAGLDVDTDGNADFTLNRPARFFGDVRQYLVEDFAVSGSDGGGFRGVGRRKRIGAQGRRGGSRGGRRPRWSRRTWC